MYERKIFPQEYSLWSSACVALRQGLNRCIVKEICLGVCKVIVIERLLEVGTVCEHEGIGDSILGKRTTGTIHIVHAIPLLSNECDGWSGWTIGPRLSYGKTDALGHRNIWEPRYAFKNGMK